MSLTGTSVREIFLLTNGFHSEIPFGVTTAKAEQNTDLLTDSPTHRLTHPLHKGKLLREGAAAGFQLITQHLTSDQCHRNYIMTGIQSRISSV